MVFHMHRLDWLHTLALVVIAILLGIIAARTSGPMATVTADSGLYDYVQIVSPAYIYNGRQGLLVMDKRNGNVWFLAKHEENMKLSFGDPAFVVRVPLEKLDAAGR
jgi:hypothetical protein